MGNYVVALCSLYSVQSASLPQGTGSNRCFLGAKDTAWLVNTYAQVPRNLDEVGEEQRLCHETTMLKVLQNHEVAFKLLQQTPESLRPELLKAESAKTVQVGLVNF